MQDLIVTGSQLRAARGALNWSVRQLSEASGVGTTTIVRYEAVEGVPPNRSGNLAKVVSALEAAGIEFTGTPDHRPGIVMRL